MVEPSVRHVVGQVETNLEESKAKITSDTDQAVNALNGRIDFTNKEQLVDHRQLINDGRLICTFQLLSLDHHCLFPQSACFCQSSGLAKHTSSVTSYVMRATSIHNRNAFESITMHSHLHHDPFAIASHSVGWK